MEHVKFPELIKPVNETISSGMPALHFNVPSLQSKPAAASLSHRFQLGVVVCLVLVFFLSRCYLLISSRVSKAFDKRRLASGGGTSGEGNKEREGDEQCAGPSEPVEDDETPLLESIAEFQSTPPKSQQSGLVGSVQQQTQVESSYGGPLGGDPMSERRDDVRKTREKVGRAVDILTKMLQQGMDALNENWSSTNPHWPFCLMVFDALVNQQSVASSLFNTNNRRFGTRERIVWIGKLRNGHEAISVASSVLSAFADAHGLPGPHQGTQPSGQNFKLHCVLCIGETTAKLEDAMEQYMGSPGVDSLAALNAAMVDASFWLRVFTEMMSCSGLTSRPGSTPVDLLDDALKNVADALRHAHMQSMRMLSQI
ncbi:hypothetical protein EAH_00010850 [Eimeria acervulina]|uniref:Transmembrane protein n=1 Tax=Eimeria acervulina TaxID=5801 RepID=U6GLB0_EIMAC|nr:hypothetical protein EAH_00010850 [Eimeria acervulina]CDI79394.1 hypothetical protein EAH_00010850 [Eimeria acervulina]